MKTTSMTVFGDVPDPIKFVNDMGESIAKSKFAGCENIDQGKFFVLTCLARRCDPMYLAERYDIIKGRLRMKSVVMLARFRAMGGSHRVVERSAEAAEIELTYHGQTESFRLTWEEAQEEDFTTDSKGDVKSNYGTPRKRMQMMWARVMSDGVAVMCPEVLLGEEEVNQAHTDPLSVGSRGSEDVSPGERVSLDAPTPVVSSVADDIQEDEAVDAEFEVANKEPIQVLDVVSTSVDEPCTEDQKKLILAEMKTIHMAGVPDIGDRVKSTLAKNGLEKLNDLTISEAEEMLSALKLKQIEAWSKTALVGHSPKK